MGMIRGGWGRLTMLSYFKLFDIIANESSRSPWNDVIIICYSWALVRSGETTRPLTVWQLFDKCSIWENPNLAELICADLLCGGRPVGVWYFPCIQSHHAQSWKWYFKATWGRWQSVLAALFPLTSLHPGHNFHENHDDATGNVDDDHNKRHLYPLSWCSVGLWCEKCHRGGTWHCQSDDKDDNDVKSNDDNDWPRGEGPASPDWRDVALDPLSLSSLNIRPSWSHYMYLILERN